MMIALLLAAAPAFAVDAQWWGVGPTIETMAIPSSYPFSFPAAVRDTNDKGEDVLLVDKVRGDVEIGARAVLYPGKTGRITALGTLGFGTSHFFQPELVLGYDAVLVKDESFQLLFGGGIGAGHETYGNADNDDKLKVNYFPLRAGLSALLRDKSRAYEIGLWGTYHLVSSQRYCAADAECVDGKTKPDGTEATVAGAAYGALGAQATLFFGDFRNKGSSGKGKSSSKSSSQRRK